MLVVKWERGHLCLREVVAELGGRPPIGVTILSLGENAAPPFLAERFIAITPLPAQSTKTLVEANMPNITTPSLLQLIWKD